MCYRIPSDPSYEKLWSKYVGILANSLQKNKRFHPVEVLRISTELCRVYGT